MNLMLSNWKPWHKFTKDRPSWRLNMFSCVIKEKRGCFLPLWFHCFFFLQGQWRVRGQPGKSGYKNCHRWWPFCIWPLDGNHRGGGNKSPGGKGHPKMLCWWALYMHSTWATARNLNTFLKFFRGCSSTLMDRKPVQKWWVSRTVFSKDSTCFRTLTFSSGYIVLYLEDNWIEN